MRASDVCMRVRVCVCARACVSGSASVSLPRGPGRAAILDTSSLRATLWPVNFPVDSSPSISKFPICILQTSALREWTGRPRKSTHRHMPCRNSCSARPRLFRELGCLTCSTVPLVVRAGSGSLLVRDGATRQQREQPWGGALWQPRRCQGLERAEPSAHLCRSAPRDPVDPSRPDLLRKLA